MGLCTTGEITPIPSYPHSFLPHPNTFLLFSIAIQYSEPQAIKDTLRLSLISKKLTNVGRVLTINV